MHTISPLLTKRSRTVQADARAAGRLPISQACDRKGGRVAKSLKRSSCLRRDLESEHRCFHEARGALDIDIRPDFVCRCVPKTLSVLMTPRNHLSWRNDRAPVFRRGGLGLTIQVEVTT